MGAKKLEIYDEAMVVKGEDEGQSGTVMGYDPGKNEYFLKIMHQGFPDNHYHRRWINSRCIRKVERG